jgi:hypothetical protein
VSKKIFSLTLYLTEKEAVAAGNLEPFLDILPGTVAMKNEVQDSGLAKAAATRFNPAGVHPAK